MATQVDNSGEVGTGLTLKVRTSDAGRVVALAGEIDMATAPQLGPVIRRLLEQGHHAIVIDLDAVTFVDGSAIGALIAASQEVAATGGCLQITPHALCERLLRITGETTQLTIKKAWCGRHRPGW